MFNLGEGCMVGEFVFVVCEGFKGEDDGYVIMFVYD